MALPEKGAGSQAWKWAIAGTAAVATGAACYYGYRYYASTSGKGSADDGLDDAEVAHRLRLAKQLQMRTLRPSPPARAQTAATAGATKPKATAPGSRKQCAECTKALTGLPLRCSSCKATYYCSKECQRTAWPAHKAVCKSGGAASGGGTSNGAGPCDTSSVGTTQGPPMLAGSGQASAPGGQESRPQQTMQEALASMLQESAASQSDEVESRFETAVMQFLRGNYRAAIDLLLEVQGMARARSQVPMEGEVYKWLGHCWGKLADVKKAETYFTEGAEFAADKGLKKVQLDCLGGLGMMCRAQDDPNRALLFLGKAMELAEEMGDIESKASTLVNMGNVLMQVEPEKGLAALEKAVELREAQIEAVGEHGERAMIATAVMEHATAMVNLASALYVCKKMDDAKVAYEKSLEVFELVEDHEKVVKVLINLANMCELQMKDKPDAKSDAARYRDRLLSFLQRTGARVPEDTCAVCLDPMRMASPSEASGELIVLACMHCLHDACWSKHVSKAQASEDGHGGVACPTCRQPVLLYG